MSVAASRQFSFTDIISQIRFRFSFYFRRHAFRFRWLIAAD